MPYKDTNSTAPLDTLVFPRKAQENQGKKKAQLTTLQKRARSKFYTQKILWPLVTKIGYKLEKQYIRAYHCAERIEQTGNKFRTHYCNSRLCNTCNRIRTAKMIKGYMPQIENLSEPQFVTLTVKAVNSQDLRSRIADMQSDFRKIKDTLRKRKTPINGILKLECNYNPEKKTFNPHFHIIVDGKELGEEIINLWLNRPNNKRCLIKAQDIRPCDENSLMEVFKYSSKVFIKMKKEEKGTLEVHHEALNIIMEAMSFKKTITPLGNIHKVCDEVKEEELIAQPELGFEEVTQPWLWYKKDWINEHGELLSGWKGSRLKFVYPQSFRVDIRSPLSLASKNPFIKMNDTSVMDVHKYVYKY